MSDYYVSPTGTSAGDGSKDRPWDIRTGIASSNLAAGDIFLRGGTYRLDPVSAPEAVYLAGEGIRLIKAYPGETPSIVITLGTGTTEPVLKKVPWPKTEAAQNTVMATQRAEGYYPYKNVTGAFMTFEKVK